jgi:signal transduction histidine kinase
MPCCDNTIIYQLNFGVKDLTRLESGNETSFNEPFDLPMTIEDATNLYRTEASRRGLQFILDTSSSPRIVIGDPSKIRTVVANLTANSRTSSLALLDSFLKMCILQ